MFDTLPPVLREAVQLVLSDLQHPVAVPLEKVTFESDPEDDRFGVLTVWLADGSCSGFGLETGCDPAEVTAEVADQIQGFSMRRASRGARRDLPAPDTRIPRLPTRLMASHAGCARATAASSVASGM